MPYCVRKPVLHNFSKHTMMVVVVVSIMTLMLQSVQTSCSPHLAYSEFRSCSSNNWHCPSGISRGSRHGHTTSVKSNTTNRESVNRAPHWTLCTIAPLALMQTKQTDADFGDKDIEKSVVSDIRRSASVLNF